MKALGNAVWLHLGRFQPFLMAGVYIVSNESHPFHRNVDNDPKAPFIDHGVSQCDKTNHEKLTTSGQLGEKRVETGLKINIGQYQYIGALMRK